MASEPTTVTIDKTSRAIVWGGIPLVGAALGLGLALLTEWIASLPWFPFQGLFELLTGLRDAYLWAGGIAAGMMIGFAFATFAANELLRATVSNTGVELSSGEWKRTFPKDDIASAVHAGEELVLADKHNGELAREDCDLDWDELAAAFRKHGYAWADSDPHESEFEYWPGNSTALSPELNEALKTRAAAIANDKTDDARSIRDDLASHGVVVKTVKKKQYWRRSGGTSTAE
ncbi:YqeB family protein [Salininema proteolyticum]|uniref:DUF308 domain-containing protein n=1 Tax=Salininema proteolyticum TaxID=1607685 RepID=A0ABV8TU82_9ACTN